VLKRRGGGFRLSVLELRATPDSGVHVLIDGRDLREIVQRAEAPHAAAAGTPEVAGSYAGMQAWEWAHPPDDEDGREAVLGCTCGVTECQPLFARITRKAGTVVWSDFDGPLGKAAYERVGPFTFTREQYEAAVAVVRADSARG